MKLLTPEMFVSSHVSEEDSRVMVVVTRVAEMRVPLKHAHVFAAEGNTTRLLDRAVFECLSPDRVPDDLVDNSVVYYSPAADIMQKYVEGVWGVGEGYRMTWGCTVYLSTGWCTVI